jgi:hypothetical protein
VVSFSFRRLYKEQFSTFEEYCQSRWGWTSTHARRLIEAAEVTTEMKNAPIGSFSNPLPIVQNEAQARELAKIKDPEIRAQVWQQVNEVAAPVSVFVSGFVSTFGGLRFRFL